MKPLCRLTGIAGLVLLLPSLAQAHPGHDGHELTWDMLVTWNIGHLAAHPVATAGCAVALTAGVWAVVRVTGAARRRAATKRMV